MPGRLRPADIFSGVLGVLLVIALFAVPISESGGQELLLWESMRILRWLVLGFALLSISIPVLVVVRSTATAAIAAAIVILLTSLPLLVLVVAHQLIAPPDVTGSNGTPTAIGMSIGLLIIAIVGSAYLTLRDESRGIKPSAGAPVSRLDLPGQHSSESAS